MTTTDRPRQSTCPTWCLTKHYNWDTDAPDHAGPQWPTVRGDDGSSVHVSTAQTANGDVVVRLSVRHGENLTPRQARAASRTLLAAATWVENNRTD
jgi:hypothetical protein